MLTRRPVPPHPRAWLDAHGRLCLSGQTSGSLPADQLGPTGSRSHAKVTVLLGDVLDQEFLLRACQGVTLVIHSACVVDPFGYTPAEVIMDVNVKGTQLLLETCVQTGVPFFIYTSTLEVMGPNSYRQPAYNVQEDQAPESTCRSPYPLSKRLAEKAVLAADGWALPGGDGGGGALRTCSLRPTFIFGEGSTFLSRSFQRALRRGLLLDRMNWVEAQANPVYVGNVAWAHVLAARALRDPERAPRLGGQFFFVADDTPHMSYTNLNFELGQALGFRKPPRRFIPLPVLYCLALLLELVSFLLRPLVRFVPAFDRHLLTLTNTTFTFSYKKAQKDFGYRPLFSWEDAKSRTTQWIRSLVEEHRQSERMGSQ
uniref:3-beta hydroxysteroid dehydrogenase/isomerase domain-containing protein n=1 Tax=Ornithorhynchus anatinus TaxID=9258 RepID=K7E974_ORNAN